MIGKGRCAEHLVLEEVTGAVAVDQAQVHCSAERRGTGDLHTIELRSGDGTSKLDLKVCALPVEDIAAKTDEGRAIAGTMIAFDEGRAATCGSPVVAAEEDDA